MNFTPADGKSQFVFSNLILKGNCSALPAVSSYAKASASATVSPSSSIVAKANGAEYAFNLIGAAAIAGLAAL